MRKQKNYSMKMMLNSIKIICAFLFFISGSTWAGTYSGGSGTDDDPFQISCIEDWYELIDNPDDWVKQFILTANLDFSGATITPVGNYDNRFTGVLDGNSHVLSNFIIDQPNDQYVGLFGFLESGGQVKNLGVESFTITGHGPVGGLCGVNNNGTIKQCYTSGKVMDSSSYGPVGGLCGYNLGDISESYSSSEVIGSETVGGLCGLNVGGTISRSYTTGIVVGNYAIGGLCGRNVGTISQCEATGTVTGNSNVGGLCGFNDPDSIISESLATGKVTGDDTVGGLCGNNEGTISQSYATGIVTGGNNAGGLCGVNYSSTDFFGYATIFKSYATGVVTGDDFVGGLVGMNMVGTISQSYATGSVNGDESIGGLCGSNNTSVDNTYSTINQCYATGAVTGNNEVGGLVGKNEGDAGDEGYSVAYIVESYSTGHVNGTDSIGGLVGSAYMNSMVERCFWDMETSGMSVSAGGTGNTTSQMKTKLTYTLAEWDFTNTWIMPTGDYPRFNWQQLPDDQIAPIIIAEVPSVVSTGVPFNILGQANDTDTGGSLIAGAAYSLDGGETWIDMSAVDGNFSTSVEAATANVPGLSVDVYRIYLKTWDSAGNIGYSEPTLLAVYDPSAGFVTGGGWINSPAGALHPSLEELAGIMGKANFGFVSKYKKGANIPTGNTEFHFKSGNLNFKSTTYQWLVVAGAKAKFKGEGMLNQMTGYGFMLSAIDGALLGNNLPDRFRIKIWENETGVIVYDNQAGSDDTTDLVADGTLVQGGNIVIHNGK